MSGKLIAASLLGIAVIGGAVGARLLFAPQSDAASNALPAAPAQSVGQSVAQPETQLGAKPDAGGVHDPLRARTVIEPKAAAQQAAITAIPSQPGQTPAGQTPPAQMPATDQPLPALASSVVPSIPQMEGQAAAIAPPLKNPLQTLPQAAQVPKLAPGLAPRPAPRLNVAQTVPAQKTIPTKTDVVTRTGAAAQAMESVTVTAPKQQRTARVDIDTIGRGNSLTIELPRRK